MAKTTMKAQEVPRAQSVAQGQQVRPSVRSRLVMAFLACCATLSIWQAAYTRQEVVKDTVWTFDQLQGILYTVVPLRTVVKARSKRSSVYAPVAPTRVTLS